MSGRGRRVAASLALLVAAAGFVALGVWQLERRAWKHALIARVDARIGAAPVDPPVPSAWASVDAGHDEYRRVRLHGRWLRRATTRVKAVTRLGAGCWVLTPLAIADGTIVLVNRGFLPDLPAPSERADGPDPHPVPPSGCAARVPVPEPPETGPLDVTGLLRLSEPGGGFLRANDPGADRWTSRDVAAIATARGLHRTAPYFVDAEAAASTGSAAPDAPVGGLTVVAFRDDHLVYALTWFALAGFAAVGIVRVARSPASADV